MAIIGAVLFIISLQDSPTKPAQHLSARLSTLARLLDEGTTNVTNGDLRMLTSDAKILITGDQTAISRAMGSAGIKPATKDIILSESDGSSFAELKDAKLNGQFDVTFQRILEAKLDTTTALVDEVYAATNDAGLRTALQGAHDNIETLQTRLAAL